MTLLKVVTRKTFGMKFPAMKNVWYEILLAQFYTSGLFLYP